MRVVHGGTGDACGAEQALEDVPLCFGLPAMTVAEREQVAMMAEAIVAEAEALALFSVDGHCTNLDAVVDVPTRFTVGVIGLADAGRSPQRWETTVSLASTMSAK